MSYTADFLIAKRREKWEASKDIEYDKNFREAVASALLTDKELLSEVQRYPEKLIELVFVVVDKNQKTQPFFLNEVQREFIGILNQAREDYEAGKITDISLLVLKGRQQGFTTVVTAYQLACSLLNRNFQGFTLADRSDNSEAIFQNKAKYTYSQLPDALKPTEKFNNRKQLLFEKLNSSWAVDTATKDVGRSRTVNFFHGSECAFWQYGIAPVQGALGEAFTKNCIKIYESTANGFNDYQKMWDSGSHINCFFPWWKTPEYSTAIPDGALDDFLRRVNTGGDWIWQRLRWLRDEQGLALGQLFWYWNKWDKYIDKDLIKQEYPCSAQEAFLLSGKTAFNTEVLLERLNHVPKPIKTGYFKYDYDGLSISHILWVDDPNGFIKIYRNPDTPKVTSYCIGGDTAGSDSGEDFFVGQVLDAEGNQVAVLKHQFDSDLYAKQMYCLGMYYKEALVGIEANFDSFPIMELQRLDYPNQYTRLTPDTYTGKLEKRFGFKTTSLTRPAAINKLVEIVREHCYLINDRETIEELLTIIKNEKNGRVEAPQGCHDDMMMGLAIAHQVREQIWEDEPVINMAISRGFGYEDQYTDYGDEIVVI